MIIINWTGSQGRRYDHIDQNLFPDAFKIPMSSNKSGQLRTIELSDQSPMWYQLYVGRFSYMNCFNWLLRFVIYFSRLCRTTLVDSSIFRELFSFTWTTVISISFSIEHPMKRSDLNIYYVLLPSAPSHTNSGWRTSQLKVYLCRIYVSNYHSNIAFLHTTRQFCVCLTNIEKHLTLMLTCVNCN